MVVTVVDDDIYFKMTTFAVFLVLQAVWMHRVHPISHVLEPNTNGVALFAGKDRPHEPHPLLARLLDREGSVRVLAVQDFLVPSAYSLWTLLQVGV